MTVTFTWQDMALITIVFLWCVHLANKSGYNFGVETEKYRKHQEELEKSGNFFMAHGRMVACPKPPPKMP